MTQIDFLKMHGAGNDFVLVDLYRSPYDNVDWSEFAKYACNRHFGIGADGVLLVKGCPGVDLEMIMYNPDGSQAEMCGNGLRCFAKFLRDQERVLDDRVSVSTGGGSRWFQVTKNSGQQSTVSVGMGCPQFSPKEIPAQHPEAEIVNQTLQVGHDEIVITSVGMGNPHAVTLVESVQRFDLMQMGPLVERHPMFPAGTNFEIYEVVGPNELKMKVWERGAGMTLACGSGAAATVAAAIVTGQASAGNVFLQTDGGQLLVEWDGPGNELIMSGPAVTVFSGTCVI
tara:strand:- start:976 stop:1827 length:852 start_codon:yes stop_codon:yes gene_type:complete